MPGTVPADSSAGAPAAPEPAPRDYVAEAVEAFIKSAPKLDPRRPQTAIENHFAAAIRSVLHPPKAKPARRSTRKPLPAAA